MFAVWHRNKRLSLAGGRKKVRCVEFISRKFLIENLHNVASGQNSPGRNRRVRGCRKKDMATSSNFQDKLKADALLSLSLDGPIEAHACGLSVGLGAGAWQMQQSRHAKAVFTECYSEYYSEGRGIDKKIFKDLEDCSNIILEQWNSPTQNKKRDAITNNQASTSTSLPSNPSFPSSTTPSLVNKRHFKCCLHLTHPSFLLALISQPTLKSHSEGASAAGFTK